MKQRFMAGVITILMAFVVMIASIAIADPECPDGNCGAGWTDGGTTEEATGGSSMFSSGSNNDQANARFDMKVWADAGAPEQGTSVFDVTGSREAQLLKESPNGDRGVFFQNIEELKAGAITEDGEIGSGMCFSQTEANANFDSTVDENSLNLGLSSETNMSGMSCVNPWGNGSSNLKMINEGYQRRATEDGSMTVFEGYKMSTTINVTGVPASTP